MLLDIQMTLKIQGKGDPGVYAITKTVRGYVPALGTRITFRLPWEGEEGFVWLNGCIMGRVVDVNQIEDRGLIVTYHVELEPLLMDFEQFQQVAKAPWLKKFGWSVTETSL